MAKSTTLKTELWVKNNASPAVFVKVGGLTSIDIPTPTKNEVDTTDFDSEAEEALPTLPSNGDFTFGGLMDEGDPGQEILWLDANDPEAGLRDMKAVFTQQGKMFTFDGFVKSFGYSAPNPKSAYTYKGTIRVSGASEKQDIA